MHTGDESTAKIARGLKAVFERRKPVQCTQLIKQEPEPELIGDRLGHQRIDRNIEPEGE